MPVEGGGRNQRSALAAKIVAAQDDVDPPPAGGKDSLGVAQVELVPLFDEEQVDRIRGGDIDQRLLHAPAKGHRVDKVLKMEIAGGNRHVRVLRA